MCTSTIVILSRLGLYEGRGVQQRLDQLYEHFYTWCADQHRTTSITEFSLKKFKVTSTLDHNYKPFTNHPDPNYIHYAQTFRTSLRSRQFPRGCGKAFDTALLCKWLQHELERINREDVAPQLFQKKLLGLKLLWHHLDGLCKENSSSTQTPSKASSDRDLLELATWTFRKTNAFLHILYHSGIWLANSAAQEAVRYGFCIGELWT